MSVRPEPAPSAESDLLPALRPVDLFPVEQAGQKYLALRDPLGYAADPVIVPQSAALLLRFFDGAHTVRDLQTEVMRAYGQLLPTEDIRRFADQLDRAGYLDSASYRRRRDDVEKEFNESPVRPFCHAGQVYPPEPQALRRQLNEYFSSVEAPEIPGRLRGLVAPHIDIRFSGQEYALAYAALRGRPVPPRVVILGTAHQSPENLFVLTRKAYGTPLGPIPVDDAYVDFIEHRLGRSLYADEWAHRTEHSIEFQAVFLRYVFPTDPGLRIVPILCSSFQTWVHNGHLPGDDARIRAFLDALREADAELGPSVYIAGADLAHVGPKFGDRGAVDAQRLALLETQDRRMLASVENVDADGFFRNIQEEGDRRRICGLSPIYSLLKVLGGGEGAHKAKLLKYGQAPEPATGSVVTFASAAIYREP